jgi:DNA-binding transcriptional LysR family regulator
MLRLRALRAFILVADLESFGKAAAHLNTTQPAISARIRQLEEFYGRRLLHREARRVRLTRDGMEVLRYARPIVELMDRMTSIFEAQPRITGTMRIGAIDTIISSWLLDLFERLQVEHPEVSLEVRADTSIRLIDDLKNGEIDIALAMGPVDEEGIENVGIGTFPMAWVANPRRFRFDRPVDVTELAEHPIISYPRGSKPYRMIERTLGGASARALRLNCSNSLSTLIRLAADGFGVAAIPPVMIERELAEGQLKVIPVTQEFPGLECHAVYYTTSGSAAPGVIAAMARDVGGRSRARPQGKG